MNNIKRIIIGLFNAFGYNIIKHTPKQNLIKLLDYYKIKNVIDVGANVGQFAKFVRNSGFEGNIYSFEPLKDAFNILSKNAKQDKNWHVYNLALGDIDKNSEMNIASNSVSSSILEMTNSHLQAAPESAYFKKQSIEVRKLDSIIKDFNLNKNILLKIDAQGYEKKILIGAEKSLSIINTIQLEMSVIPLYNGEELYFEISKYLYDLGYKIIKIIPGYYDKQTKELLQFDGIFHRD